jgi:arylsulfatase A-like enzyme
MIFGMRKQSSLIVVLSTLTVLCVATQAVFFFIYYKVGSIADSLTQGAIWHGLLQPVVLLPILGFILSQMVAYGLFVAWVWFVTVSVGSLFRMTDKAMYWLGLLCWLFACFTILLLNAHYFPRSYFAEPFNQYGQLSDALLVISLVMWLGLTALAYSHCFWSKRHRWMGLVFILAVMLACNGGSSKENVLGVKHNMPNVILIGLDSVRPDYTSYFGNKHVRTPNIDSFLKGSQAFTNAYTPLGRTFPSWISILTSRYPLHSQARMNLADPAPILAHENLARKLKANGYLTIYGTDESRFTDINRDYGFDRVIGPKGGAVEFLLAGLSDFPLTNLLVNLPIGKFLFPYHYANRAADITYEPNAFLQSVKLGLANRSKQPVFLAVHLCLSHWPFRWAQDNQPDSWPLPNRYQSSVEAVDAQLGGLLAVLKEAGLMDHSVVVLLSDHGVTLGMRGDRMITENHYRGDKKKMRSVNVYKLGSAPNFTLDFKHDYTINTSYGQGTDVLSLKQYHVLMAFKGFGIKLPIKSTQEPVSLLDISPTILAMLKVLPMFGVDGVSVLTPQQHPFFIETGDKVAETESNDIEVDQVLKSTIGAYHVDKQSGLLILNAGAQQSIIESKQRAVIWRDWLLARYPSEMRYQVEPFSRVTRKPIELKPKKTQPYFVLLNLKTGLWTVDMSSSFAKAAPLPELMRELKTFYGSEVK